MSLPEPPAKKSLGQHWLDDQTVLEQICSSADLKSSDTVLEIGPGLGSLSTLLVNKASKVVAVELDEHLAKSLAGRVPASNLEIIQADILSFDFSRLPKGYKLVANIPYYLTSQLLRHITDTSNPPVIASLLVQKEVAERIVAGPGRMSLMSVAVQFYWQVRLGVTVPAELFKPPPKVDSQLLILTLPDRVLFPDVDERQFFHLVRKAFAQKRKTLLNNLTGVLNRPREEIAASCSDVGIDPKRRPQTLSMQEWHDLYSALYT